jgi:hypothetical protein
MRAVGVLLMVAGVAVLVFALVAADLLTLIIWWAFGGVQAPDSLAGPMTLGIGGALLIAGGVAVWKNAGEAK